MVERFAVVLVELDPTRGSELQKTRIVAQISHLDEQMAMLVADRLVEFFHY